VTPKEPPAIAEYRLRLDVDFEGLRWTGRVEFEPPVGATGLALHANGLEVRGVHRGSTELRYHLDPANEELVLDALDGNGPVAIDFAGVAAQQQLIGLCRSRSGAGYVLTSQCEATGARKIFPCVDRPDRKARIYLTVVAPSGLDVIANMPPTSVVDEGGRRRHVFAPTPAMATYLFYLGIGRFDRIEDKSGRIALAVYTPPGRGESGRFALAAAKRILAAYEEYYGIPYPLAKLDLIAVAEHAYGAMENWGAITFRDMRLLLDERSGSFERRDVFETIAHEIAHQWFGDLVTMAWWTDIWLNESFAAFLETKVTDRLEPAMDARADFFLRTAGMGWALDGDSLVATHPVRARVERPEEISQIFDEISYGKGSSVLAMLDAYLGEGVFRQGVTRYLNRFCYANARTEDLWESLEAAANEGVRSLVEPWVDRPGLPVVRVRETPHGLELTQREFSYRGARDATPWPIPMVIDLGGRAERLRFDTARRAIPAPTGTTVHLNPGATGFYRSLYDPPLFERLLADLPRRPPADRWIVLEDLLAFLVSGDVDWPTFVRALGALGATSDRLVVTSINSALGMLTLAFPDLAPVQSLAAEFLADEFRRIGVDRRPDEPTSTGILRERLSFTRCRIDLAFAAELAQRFPAWDTVDPDLRSAVAVSVARTGGSAGYTALRRALAERAPPEGEAIRLERALGWTPDPTMLHETLDLAVSGTINRGHVHTVVLQAAQNPLGRAVTWPWLTDQLPRLVELFRGSGFLSQLLEYSTPYLGLGRVDEVRRFYAEHPVPEGARGLAKGLERLELLEGLRAKVPSP
jgi:tricorn protease interacting factor F2/3